MLTDSTDIRMRDDESNPTETEAGEVSRVYFFLLGWTGMKIIQCFSSGKFNLGNLLTTKT